VTIKHLVIQWDDESNEITIDTKGLSVFDVVGLLHVAMALADDGIPYPQHETEESDEELD